MVAECLRLRSMHTDHVMKERLNIMKSGISSRITDKLIKNMTGTDRARIIAKLIKNMTDQELLAFIVATTKELERRSDLKPEAILSTVDALLNVKEN